MRTINSFKIESGRQSGVHSQYAYDGPSCRSSDGDRLRWSDNIDTRIGSIVI